MTYKVHVWEDPQKRFAAIERPDDRVVRYYFNGQRNYGPQMSQVEVIVDSLQSRLFNKDIRVEDISVDPALLKNERFRLAIAKILGQVVLRYIDPPKKYHVKRNTTGKVMGDFIVVPLLDTNKTGNHYDSCRAVASLVISKIKSGELRRLEEVAVDSDILSLPTPMGSQVIDKWPTFRDEFYGRLHTFLAGRR